MREFIPLLPQDDFTYVPPGQVYWSDTVNASITLYYQDLDNGVGIENADIELTDWSDSGGVGYNFVENINYSMVEIGNGEYHAEFKMDKLPYEWSKDWFEMSAMKLGMQVNDQVAEKVLSYYDGDLRKVISDFFTKFKGKNVTSWNPKPTYADRIFNAQYLPKWIEKFI